MCIAFPPAANDGEWREYTRSELFTAAGRAYSGAIDRLFVMITKRPGAAANIDHT